MESSSSAREQSVHSVHSAIDSEPEDLLASTPFSLARAVLARRPEYVRPCRTRIKVGTWNVAACPGTDKDLAHWFIDGEGIHEDIGLYVLGLQEVVDLNPTREYMNIASYNSDGAGPANKNKWKAALEAAMPRGYQLVVSEQMTGLLLLIYASPEVAPTVGNVSTQQIGTGLLGYFGNKGAVVTRLVLSETTRLVFVNCHFASGASPSSFERRCWDVGQVLSRTQFEPVVTAGMAEDGGSRIGDEDFAFWIGDLNFRLDGLPGEDIRRLLTLHARGEYDLKDRDTKPPPPIEGSDGVFVNKASTDSDYGDDDDNDTATLSSISSKSKARATARARGDSLDSASWLPDPDDFPEDPSQDPASLQSAIDSLLPHDQLRRIIAQQKFFHDGWKEGHISFLPTYKYDVGTVGLFDSSDKRRAPSWCDRILYRSRKDKEAHDKKIQDAKDARKRDEEMRSRGVEEDDDVLFSYDPETDGEEQPKKEEVPPPAAYDEYDEYDEDADDDDNNNNAEAEGKLGNDIALELYMSHQEVMSSDHKPVTSIFTLTHTEIDPEKRAIIHAEVAREFDRAENEGRPGVTLVVENGKAGPDGGIDFGPLGFYERHACAMTIANTSGVAAHLEFLPNNTTRDGSGKAGSTTTTTGWLKTTFYRSEDDHEHDHEQGHKNEALGDSVTLEPGETLSVVIEAQVCDMKQLRALNDGSGKLEDVLILRVEGGRDHFLPMFGTWLPSCLGRSIDELIRVPEGGIRRFIEERGFRGSIPLEGDVHCSAPRELFRLTEAVQLLTERCVADEAMLEDLSLPRDAGWPFQVPGPQQPQREREREREREQETQALQARVIQALDTSEPSLVDSLPVELASPRKLEIISSILLLFLASLTDGLVPPPLWLNLSLALPNITTITNTLANTTSASTSTSAYLSDAKNQVLDVLSASPSHNIAFVFLTATLARVASELGPVTQDPRPLLSKRLSFRPGIAEKEGELARKRRARERRFAELVGPLAFRSGSGVDEKENGSSNISSGGGGSSSSGKTRERERVLMEVFLRREEESG